LTAVVLLAGPGSACADDSWVYAGIEIGGKGVKATVVKGKPGGLYKRLFARTHNTTLSVLKDGAFDKAAIDETVNAIVGFIKSISAKYKVAPGRIVVVGSSGLPKASNRVDFIQAVKKATGKELRFIDDRTEVELTIAGVIPKEDRLKSISLDIGSGNTKGGYKPAGFPLVYVAVPLGTVTFTERVRQEMKARDISFVEAAIRLRESDLVAPLRKGANKMPELAKRKTAYISGGMVWAMVTLVRPADVDKAYVTFTPADVKSFLNLVTKKPGTVPMPDLEKVTDVELKKRAEKEAASVNKTYTPENLVAGAEILMALVKAFELEGRTLIFPRNGFVGWLAAYITGEKLEDAPVKPK
jgi:hypothetical protein